MRTCARARRLGVLAKKKGSFTQAECCLIEAWVESESLAEIGDGSLKSSSGQVVLAALERHYVLAGFALFELMEQACGIGALACYDRILIDASESIRRWAFKSCRDNVCISSPIRTGKDHCDRPSGQRG